MSPARHSVLAPCCKVGLHLDALHAVHRHDVELARALVVFERIAGADDYPTVGDAVVAEHLALQETKHHGHERLAYAVDLVEEQDALLASRLLDALVDACDDFAHRVFRDVDVALAVAAFRDERQAHGRLARVVRHGVVHKSQVELRRHLRHDRGLADAGRPQKENRALRLDGHHVLAEGVFGEVRDASFSDLLFCLLDVHLSLAFARKIVGIG